MGIFAIQEAKLVGYVPKGRFPSGDSDSDNGESDKADQWKTAKLLMNN